MTAIHLHGGPVRRLKKYSLKQLPDVKHGHVLEALSSALGFNTWASFSAKLALAAPFADRKHAQYRHVSVSRFRQRLNELGYVQAPASQISFTPVENGEDIIDDIQVIPFDATRDAHVLRKALAPYGLAEPRRELLIRLIQARRPLSEDVSEALGSLLVSADSAELDKLFPELPPDVPEVRRHAIAAAEIAGLFDTIISFNVGARTFGFGPLENYRVEDRLVYYTLHRDLGRMLKNLARQLNGSQVQQGLIVIAGKSGPQKAPAFSLEDPPEYRSAWAIQTQIEVAEPAEFDPDRRARYLSPPPVCGSKSSKAIMRGLGAVVAYERGDGSMALSTWSGETISVWAKFDVAELPPLAYMRHHLAEVFDIDDPRPIGAIRIICFVASHSADQSPSD
ncbi:hypothetical protein [Paraburkholderia sp. SIMBA_054]|uniref:hypothetical protein n=1 Tax=Paraburkholderia sp. SIMBA_054 TaxID=3085795 RepID=UPI00397AD6F0